MSAAGDCRCRRRRCVACHVGPSHGATETVGAGLAAALPWATGRSPPHGALCRVLAALDTFRPRLWSMSGVFYGAGGVADSSCWDCVG